MVGLLDESNRDDSLTLIDSPPGAVCNRLMVSIYLLLAAAAAAAASFCFCASAAAAACAVRLASAAASSCFSPDATDDDSVVRPSELAPPSVEPRRSAGRAVPELSAGAISSRRRELGARLEVAEDGGRGMIT